MCVFRYSIGVSSGHILRAFLVKHLLNYHINKTEIILHKIERPNTKISWQENFLHLNRADQFCSKAL